MPLEAINALGLIAGALTTVSFVPQVMKIWRTKSGNDVSYGMFLLDMFPT
ncbi:SemiSWEET family sugar transporter [Methylomagnum sp.]